MTEVSNQKKCHRCGKGNLNSANYCHNCGLRLDIYIGLSLCIFNQNLKSEMFRPERINEMAEQLTREMDPEAKDRLLKSLPPEVMDLVVVEVEKFLILIMTKTYGTFAQFVADEINRYKDVEESKRPPKLQELMDLVNEVLK